ncbi:MAG TPA: hypothetical protein VFR17_13440 [Mycobacterium sp.]|nr:hypothetical protein [Mycobacterium sp.]
MGAWFNYAATSKILVFGVLVGAGLPALFAIGVRLHAIGAGAVGEGAHRNPVLIALSWLIYALTLAAVVVGVLFIARDFIAYHTGWHILGAKHT